MRTAFLVLALLVVPSVTAPPVAAQSTVTLQSAAIDTCSFAFGDFGGGVYGYQYFTTSDICVSRAGTVCGVNSTGFGFPWGGPQPTACGPNLDPKQPILYYGVRCPCSAQGPHGEQTEVRDFIVPASQVK